MELVTREVNFNGAGLLGILKDGKIYTPLKKFCEILGVDYSSQLKRIGRDETLTKGVVKMTIPTNGGNQEINILEIEFLPLWLTGIKANQCREAVRTNLLDFKLKAKDALADAFLGKRTAPIKSKDWGLNTIKENTVKVEEIENQIEDLISQLKPLYEEIEKVAFLKADDFSGTYKIFKNNKSTNKILKKEV